MNYLSKEALMDVSINTWIAQFVYVAVSLVVLVFIFGNLTNASVPASSTRLFIGIYIAVMIIGNVIWRLTFKYDHFVAAVIIMIVTLALNFMISQVFVTQAAHSSFENYYKFRGCSELISQSENSALCNLPSGETIKLVEYKGKWYLDGDLPNGWFNF